MTLDIFYAVVQFAVLEQMRALAAAVVVGELTAQHNLAIGFITGALTATATELAAADIPVVLLYDNPRFPIDVPTCLSRAVRRGEPLESACMQRQSQVLDARMAQMRRDIAAGHSRISSLELTRHYCQDGNCPAYRDGLVVYRDNNHLSAAFANRIADSIGAEIERLIAR